MLACIVVSIILMLLNYAVDGHDRFLSTLSMFLFGGGYGLYISDKFENSEAGINKK